jgi:hypothetical protein
MYVRKAKELLKKFTPITDTQNKADTTGMLCDEIFYISKPEQEWASANVAKKMTYVDRQGSGSASVISVQKFAL